MLKTVEMDFQFMNYIDGPPKKLDDMWKQACSNDGVTIKKWGEQWVSQTKENHKKYGPFKNNSINEYYKKFERQPIIVAGSGPSLKENIEQLKEASDKGFPIVSCLHNYHYFKDNGIKVFAYVSLDAGSVVIDEIAEGGKKTLQEYIALTKEDRLFAYAASDPKLLELWQGEYKFFTCPLPSKELMEEIRGIEKFNSWVSTGGTVLGAAMYISKAYLGASTIAFIGADFSFSYNKKFHGWDSKYDKDIGHCIRATDVWGNSRYTWRSYYNFKVWFDYICTRVPGDWVNCTEGGILGAYPEGNIKQIRQMLLKDFVRIHSMYEDISDQITDPDKESFKILF